MRDMPRNLSAEPNYPGIQTVMFSMRFPDFTCHLKISRCEKEWPHYISDCREWKD